MKLDAQGKMRVGDISMVAIVRDEEEQRLLEASTSVNQRAMTLKLVGIVLVPAIALLAMSANSFVSAIIQYQVCEIGLF